MARAAEIITHNNKDQKSQQTDRVVLENQNLSPIKEQAFVDAELPPKVPDPTPNMVFPKYEPLVPHDFTHEEVDDLTMTYGNKLKEAYELLAPLKTSEGGFRFREFKSIYCCVLINFIQ